MARQKDMSLVLNVVRLLQSMATQSQGLTVKEITDILEMSETTVRRILKDTDGIKQAIRPTSAVGYWFDADVAKQTLQQILPTNRFGEVTGEWFPVGERTLPTPELINRLSVINDSVLPDRLKRAVESLAQCHESSQAFLNSGGNLDPDVYEQFNTAANEVREAAEFICKVFSTYQQDPRLNSPEYWAVFLDA